MIDIQKVRTNDPSEVRVLAHMVSQWTYNAAYSYLKNHQDAEEIVQDTLVKVIKGLLQNDKVSAFRNQSSLKTWAYRIAINQAKDRLRYLSRQKRAAHVSPLESEDHRDKYQKYYADQNNPQSLLEGKETLDLMWEGIDSLPENQRDALLMAKIDHLTMKEIAEIKETSVKAVESLIGRAKRNFKRFLEEKYYNQ